MRRKAPRDAAMLRQRLAIFAATRRASDLILIKFLIAQMVLACAWKGMTSEDTMRTVLVGFTLALIALAASPAQARYRHHHLYNYSAVQPHYESCDCWFGYNGTAAGVCTPMTSCLSEGGRCHASCAPQTGSLWYRTPQGAAAPAQAQ
jgi:hypothetical protein